MPGPDAASLRKTVAKHLRHYRPAVEALEADRTAIRRRLLGDERLMDGPDFTRLATSTLAVMFEEYDQRFFDGMTRPLVEARSGYLEFRLSKRMTKTGGKTTRVEYSRPNERGRLRDYEITLSSQLLFQSFRQPGRPESVTGIVCHHRIDAMMRIFEHELIHLLEMLVWDDSSCAAGRFKAIAKGLFLHTESTHELPGPADTAKRQFGIVPGQWVRFSFEGRQHKGFVNRIHRRATVLVEHPGGELYSNGKTYRKFYVPVQQLQPIRRPA